MGFGVWGLGFGARGSGFGVWGLGFRVRVLGFGPGCRDGCLLSGSLVATGLGSGLHPQPSTLNPQP